MIFPLLAYIATDLSPLKFIVAPVLFFKLTQPPVVISSCAIAIKPLSVPVIALLLVIVELASASFLNAAAVPELVLSKSESTSTVILLLSNKNAL